MVLSFIPYRLNSGGIRPFKTHLRKQNDSSYQPGRGFFFEGFGSGVDACMDGGMHRPVCFSNELKTSS